VGDEVRAAFMAHAGADAALGARLAACFSPAGQPGKFMASLPGLARLRLQAAGVADLHGNDGSAPWCTVGNPERYFSYRRDQQRLGASGRMCAYIWLRD
jgi:copper oxidase (laccase) domain-containing protein